MKNKKSVKKSVKKKIAKKKNNDLKNKKDLLGGLIIIVLLLLVLVTYVMCYDYKKNNPDDKIEINDNSLSIINIYEDYSVLKLETKDNINKNKKIIGTYNCKYDDCNVYISKSFDSVYSKEYIVLKENNKVFIYNFKDKKITSNLYDDIEVSLENNNYIVKNNNLYGMISNDGMEITTPEYDEILIDNIYNNQAKIIKDSLYGILNINDGNVIIETKYENINIDTNDKYSVLENNSWYVIDSGSNILTNSYSYTYSFNKGFIALIDNNLKILKYNKDSDELLNETIIPIYQEKGYKIKRDGSNIIIEIYNNDVTEKYEYNINRNILKK